MRLVRGAFLLGLMLAAVMVFGWAWAADPSALWNIVNEQCVPHQQADGDPAPCRLVDLDEGVSKGFAILKDIRGVAQFLLIPTARIGGIEDEAILAPGAPNYWDEAWRARSFVDNQLHRTLPRDAVALAINSIDGRTQNQLHIHIDCIRPDVRAAVAANLEQVGTAWTPFPVPLAGHMYRAIRIRHDTLDGINPFRMVAAADPPSRGKVVKGDGSPGDVSGGDVLRDAMGLHTLVLTGARFADGTDGFVLLDDHADLARGNRGAGEDLLDHSCKVAGK